ncbi:MAG: hypothetical protein CM15mP102_09710 [Flavobacteriales bacterium]|nr:MAG: hypothetical protein CM15mP102_09710 [Flavobacteriales bacterium]
MTYNFSLIFPVDAISLIIIFIFHFLDKWLNTIFIGQISYAIKLSLFFLVILANPPRFINVLYSGKRYSSPTGTRGAP